MVSLELIVALADNFVIGINKEIPWHLSEDLKHFKAVTLNSNIVMGRRTFESIGRPLPKRRNIVISRDKSLCENGVEVVSSLDEACRLVEKEPKNGFPCDRLIVIGGERLYKEALPKAKVLHLTRIHQSFAGDTYFPDWQNLPFKKVSSEDHFSDECGFAYTFETWTLGSV